MRLKGFTLIEMVVVMLVVGILIAIAYPSYTQHIASARRADGKAALLDLASRMERYFSERNTYQTATIGTGGANDVLASSTSSGSWYQLSISAQNATSFTLQARPLNAQGTADRECQTLTLNSLGVKGIIAGPNGSPTGTATDCW